MAMELTQLQCKEVICVANGQRLGFVGDVQIDVPEGTVRAIVVPCPARPFSLVGHREDYIIPWRCIQRIGPDIVLVDADPGQCRCQRGKLGMKF